MSFVRPRLELMDRDQIERVHRASLRLLSDTGIRVDSKRARGLFEKATGNKSKDNTVYIPEALVTWALSACPSQVDIFDRNREAAFSLGPAHNACTRFGTGVTNLYYQEPATDQVVPFCAEHVGLTTRLADTLAGFDVVSTPGMPSDLPGDTVELQTAVEMAANTQKPLVVLVSDEARFFAVLRLLEHLFGDLSSAPFVIPYLNPVTPLILNDDTVEKLWHSVRAGLPVIYSNYSMYGATAPMIPAGALALLNAELLAGIALAQLMQHGAGIIAGSLPAGFEMTSMSSVFTPASLLMNLCCAEMMAYYGIPHCGTSGCGTGWGPDLPAAGILWINHLTSCIGKVGLAPFVGGNFDSLAFSPSLVVYADQVIRQARAFAEGFTLDEAAFLAEEIRQVGPGGTFLTAPSTLKEIAENRIEPSLWPQLTLEKWQKQNRPRASALLRKHTCELLDSLKPPGDSHEIVEKGQEWIEKNRG